MKNYLAVVCLLFAANIQAHSLSTVLLGLRNGGLELYMPVTGRSLFSYPSAREVKLFQEKVQRIRETKLGLAQEVDGVIGALAQGKEIPRDAVERLARKLENIASGRRDKQEVLKFLEDSGRKDGWIVGAIKKGRFIVIPLEEVSVAVTRNGYGNNEIIEFFANELPEHEYLPVLTGKETFILSTPEGYESFEKLLLRKRATPQEENPLSQQEDLRALFSEMGEGDSLLGFGTRP